MLKLLCFFGFHNLEYSDDIIFEVDNSRSVLYQCTCCDYYTIKEYDLATEPDNRFK